VRVLRQPYRASYRQAGTPPRNALRLALRQLDEERLTCLVSRLDYPPVRVTAGQWFPSCPMVLAGYNPYRSLTRTTSELAFARAWMRELYDRTRATLAEASIELPPFEDFWREGRVAPPPASMPVKGSFAALREEPERFPFDTPSGRLEITSETIASFGYEDCPATPRGWSRRSGWVGRVQFPLHLVSNQPARRLHSQYDNGSHSREGKVAGRESVLIHPDDAAARDIVKGDVVRLFNDRGACLAGAVVSDVVRPGVVALSTGAWFDPVDPGTSGTLDRHGNPNVLTLDRGTSRLAQGSSAGTALIELERVGDHASFAPRAFEPPTVVDVQTAAALVDATLQRRLPVETRR
jgi:biotin/methionine sulfoxide reductase